MAKSGKKRANLTNNEIRRIMLEYFYDRNKNATSSRGKKGSAVKISDVKKELKATHSLTQQEVQSNLTYLISQGWVGEDAVEKSFTAPGGTVMPSTTSYYQITAAGIDKIEGPENLRCRSSRESIFEQLARTSLRWVMGIRSMRSLATSARHWRNSAKPLLNQMHRKLTR